MNCVELRESLVEIEEGSSPEQQAHLKTCPECSALVAELNLIASTAVELRAADEPSPRVWNSIEIALRREGLIRPRRVTHSLLPSFGSSWGMARWLIPAAAALLLAVGIYVRPHSPARPSNTTYVASSAPSGTDADLEMAGLNDDDLLQGIAQQSPALREEYAESLRRVNASIRDAKAVVAAYPNDDDAHRSLMEAYQQKAMLFELALDRSLP